MKQFEIMDKLPVYGPMYVPFSYAYFSGYSEGFVVKFFNSDGSEWVGNFQLGKTNFNWVRRFHHSELTMVISGGVCYLINLKTKEISEIVDVGFTGIIENPNGGFLLEDSLGILVFDEKGKYWYKDRISLGGFESLRVVDHRVYGYSCSTGYKENTWDKFELDLKTKELSGGSYSNLLDSLKPWWKFW